MKNIAPIFRSHEASLLSIASLKCCASLVLLVFAITTAAFAGSATWKATPVNGDWNNAANWTAGGPPNGPADVATFSVSNITDVSISADTEVNRILFKPGASAFTITPSVHKLTISGIGITNNSGVIQNFVVPFFTGPAQQMVFTNSATAGSSTNFTNYGRIYFTQSSTAGSATFTNTFDSSNNIGFLSFEGNSTAGTSTILNHSNGAAGGAVAFDQTSTADNATVIADGSASFTAFSASITFNDDATGGSARMELFGTAYLTVPVGPPTAQGVAVGSIEGDGFIFLYNKKLTVGTNNLNTVFSGIIRDRPAKHAPPKGGSLVKTGTGKLTLKKSSTYSGGTTLLEGTLQVKNANGSATGTGPVSVTSGTLTGTGTMMGAVTLGTGSSSGAILLPGISDTSPGTLTVSDEVTFNSLSTYECVLNRATPAMGTVSALGVTINNNASFDFHDATTGTLTAGTVFTVINNTSANPIVGTFSNLPDGSTFVSGGTTFKASYHGGTGNDLTLTVQ